MMKHCYIRMSDEWYIYIDNRYLEVTLCENDDGVLMCHVAGNDDVEVSYTGPDAEDKFNALLDVSGSVDFGYLLQLGLKQYG